MPRNIPEFLVKMDEHSWFRMIICFLPGLVFVKLAADAAPGTVLSSVSSALLIAGIALYAFWGWLRSIAMRGDDDGINVEALQDAPPYVESGNAGMTATDQLAVLKNLRTLCGEGESKSLELVDIELAVNPQLTLPEALRTALARCRMTK